ncbi:MAG: hypothetical protein JSS91_02770 [Bacteroidetes bacterium]|nr:hypothetical protein [Bacteroidota bacterium]
MESRPKSDYRKSLCSLFYFYKSNLQSEWYYPYYIQLNHRISIEVWSKNTVTFNNGDMYYDFYSAANKAYGDNQIRVDNSPVTYALYSGDVNQDGTIDLGDGSLIDNDATNFVSGYAATDVNGDGIVDVADAVFADNNALNFISRITP